MEDEIGAGEGTQQKAAGVADTINRWLQELSIKCAKAEGVRDYYHVGVIGYGKAVGPAFVGDIAGRDLVPISEIAENPARLEERVKKIPDGAGGLVEQSVRTPVWFDPVANGATPMCRAAAEAYRVIQEWLAEHPNCFPPILIHITDGEATDGDPLERVRALTSLASSDGNVMLFNIHLSANPDANAITFPSSADELPDDYSRMLFETASPLTPTMRALAKEHGIQTSESSRAFVLNADMVLLVQSIDIGTRPANLGTSPSNVAKEVPAAVAEDVADDVDEDVAEDIADDVADDVAEDIADDVADDEAEDDEDDDDFVMTNVPADGDEEDDEDLR